MKINNDKWVARYKQSAKYLGGMGHGPSDGIVCIHASLGLIADGLAEDAKKPVEAGKKPMTLEESFLELFIDCYNGKPQGFASNASAAMKAAKLESGLQVVDTSKLKLNG